MTKLTFVIREPGGEPEKRVPVEDGLTIGRHPQCGCVLKDGTVSATHARVSNVNGELLIEDLGGTNSIQADGQRLTKGQTVALSDGLDMLLGQTKILVVDETPAAAPVASAADPDMTVVAAAPPAMDPDATVVGAAPVSAPVVDPDATVVGNIAPPAAPAPVAAPAPAPTPAPAAAVPAPAVPVAPEEVLQAAAVPESSEIPVPDPTAEAEGTLVFGGDALDPNDPSQIIALQASLTKLRPRLVFANEVDRRVFLIEAAEVNIGRSADVDCTVEHPAVSSKHARVSFDIGSNRFFVEDLGGRNKTILNGEQLAPKSKREIMPESSIEFGPIQTLFVVNADSRNRPIPADRYEAALEVLTKDQKLQPHQRAQALGDTAPNERHVGESLLLAEVVTVEDWREAFKDGEALIRTGMLNKGDDGKKLKLIVGIGVGVILLIVLLAVLL